MRRLCQDPPFLDQINMPILCLEILPHSCFDLQWWFWLRWIFRVDFLGGKTWARLVAHRNPSVAYCPRSWVLESIGTSTQLLKLIAKNDVFVCFGCFFGITLPVKKSKAVDADAIRWIWNRRLYSHAVLLLTSMTKLDHGKFGDKKPRPFAPCKPHYFFLSKTS